MNRDLFEQWAPTVGLSTTRDPDDRAVYMSLRTQAAWQGWQAREQQFIEHYAGGFELPQERDNE
jgi:hypothetical protein